MAKLRTDDGAYRVQLRFLGPDGITLPFHLTYVQWGVGAATCALWELLCLVFGWRWIGCGIGMSIITTALLFRHVDPDRPVAAIVRNVVRDARTIKPPTPAELPRMTAAHLKRRPS